MSEETEPLVKSQEKNSSVRYLVSDREEKYRCPKTNNGGPDESVRLFYR